MNRHIIFFTNIELWSIAENKGGRAQISTIEAYINSGWDVYIVSTAGGIPVNISQQSDIAVNEFKNITKLTASKSKIVRQVKYIKHILLYAFFYRKGEQIIRKLKGEKVLLYAYEVDGVKAAKRLSEKYHLPLVTRFQGTVHTDTDDNIVNAIRYYPHLQALKEEADLVIMTNDGTKGLQTLRRLGNKSREIYFWRNGVAPRNESLIGNREGTREELGFNGKFIFLTVSRLVDWKRLDRSINSIYKMLDSHPGLRNEIELHIIGDGDARSSLEQMVNNLDISDNVKFHGAIPQSEVFKYMIASDVFVSLYDLSNVGNPLLEAMTCGKAIITLNNGDTGELIKNNINGYLVDMNEIDSIPEKMFTLYEDVLLRKSFGDNAMQTAKKEFWTWDARMQEELKHTTNLFECYGWQTSR